MTRLHARPERLGDRYEVLGVLGNGGMADVYLARDTALDREVAVKVLRDASHAERFRAEGRMLAMLSHPGLVSVLDVGEVDGHSFLVMELVRGSTLADLCRGEALEPARVAALGAQLAGALAYVHGAGVLHRDLKPANVLLTDDGRVLLADFGVARLTEGHAATETGFTMGTAAYLSPEQVRGQPLGTQTDVYSLGLVLLEALTGKRVYDGPPTEAAMARLHAPPALPLSVTGAWRPLLTRMTALDPAQRPSAEEVHQELAELAGEVSAAEVTQLLREIGTTRLLTVPLVLQPERARRRRLPAGWPRWVVPAAALLLVAGAVLLAVLLSDGGDATRPATPSQLPPAVSERLAELRDAVAGR